MFDRAIYALAGWVLLCVPHLSPAQSPFASQRSTFRPTSTSTIVPVASNQQGLFLITRPSSVTTQTNLPAAFNNRVVWTPVTAGPVREWVTTTQPVHLESRFAPVIRPAGQDFGNGFDNGSGGFDNGSGGFDNGSGGFDNGSGDDVPFDDLSEIDFSGCSITSGGDVVLEGVTLVNVVDICPICVFRAGGWFAQGFGFLSFAGGGINIGIFNNFYSRSSIAVRSRFTRNLVRVPGAGRRIPPRVQANRRNNALRRMVPGMTPVRMPMTPGMTTPMRPVPMTPGMAPVMRPVPMQQVMAPVMRPVPMQQVMAPGMRPVPMQQVMAPVMRPAPMQQVMAPVMRPVPMQQVMAPVMRPAPMAQVMAPRPAPRPAPMPQVMAPRGRR